MHALCQTIAVAFYTVIRLDLIRQDHFIAGYG